MSRRTVYLPPELDAALAERLPNVNVSMVLQAALRGLLGCAHESLCCATCSTAVSPAALATAARDEFAHALYRRLELPARRAERLTAEGAVRILLSEWARYPSDIRQIHHEVRPPIDARRSRRRPTDPALRHPSNHQPERKSA